MAINVSTVPVELTTRALPAWLHDHFQEKNRRSTQIETYQANNVVVVGCRMMVSRESMIRLNSPKHHQTMLLAVVMTAAVTALAGPCWQWSKRWSLASPMSCRNECPRCCCCCHVGWSSHCRSCLRMSCWSKKIDSDTPGYNLAQTSWNSCSAINRLSLESCPFSTSFQLEIPDLGK